MLWPSKRECPIPGQATLDETCTATIEFEVMTFGRIEAPRAFGWLPAATHSCCGTRTTTMPATLPGMFDAKRSSLKSPVVISRT